MTDPAQETRENNERHDDVLSRQFIGGNDNDQAARSLERRMGEGTLASFLASQQANTAAQVAQTAAAQTTRDAGDALHRREETFQSGLTFRDAAMHSTAVASLEGETATVGDEEQENVPDEEHPDSTAQK
jgi:hypothetical protein